MKALSLIWILVFLSLTAFASDVGVAQTTNVDLVERTPIGSIYYMQHHDSMGRRFIGTTTQFQYEEILAERQTEPDRFIHQIDDDWTYKGGAKGPRLDSPTGRLGLGEFWIEQGDTLNLLLLGGELLNIDIITKFPMTRNGLSQVTLPPLPGATLIDNHLEVTDVTRLVEDYAK